MGGLMCRAAVVAGAALVLLGPAVGAASAAGGAAGGTWGTAREVPGTAALNNTGGDAATNSVSCASSGNCSAGGSYTSRHGHRQAFVVNEVRGVWRTAQEVPGTAALNAGGLALIWSVSCAPAGNCTAGGSYRDRSGHFQAFVVNEVGGVWRTAQEVPGTAALNSGLVHGAEVLSVT